MFEVLIQAQELHLTMAESKAAAGWTEESKLVFILDLFESGAATIDWSIVTIPAGKTKGATRMMMKRLADAHRPQLDEMKAVREANGGGTGEAAGSKAAEPKKKATKGKAAAKNVKKEPSNDEDDAIEGDKATANIGKSRTRAPRTKAAATDEV
ncbi:uncharacterized protein LTHEOB_12647 [Neofusicoccum parvum]|uniref:Uncharacterized protein LTHEOB_12647 n=1 Tax=Neofusicoccum parvum TaxID=310453 RepID=A0ACB5S3E9_9PEZI|nr:uncharacterized protein LTHEOB_12647 [Neofusicoccum parvum]GME40526.1 uncharacterized protein LTHEOB_12647 [Neofusicoccum parvum]